MNIAFSTILLFIFLLPGLSFRRFYYSDEFSKEYFKQTFLEVFLTAFVPSIILQTLWYYLVQLIGYQVDLILIGKIITNSVTSEYLLSLKNDFDEVVLYNLTLFLFSAAFGYYSKKGIRVRKLDRKYKMFRFQNAWHYILKGEFFDFPRAAFDLEQDDVEDIEVVFIDAVVETTEGSIIYDGLLVDYELSNKGGLDTISLKEVNRRYLKADSQNTEEKNPNRYYNIPGHILVLKYEEILNLNFSYYKLRTDEHGTLLPELVR